MLKLAFQLLLIVAIAVGSSAYFSLVMPTTAAIVMTVIVTVGLVGGLAFGKMNMSVALLGGAVFAAWPAGALVAHFVAESFFSIQLGDAVAKAWAMLTAILAAHLSYTWAEKRDRARDIATTSLSVIAIYTLYSAVASGSRVALAISCALTGLAIALSRQQMILPPEIERVMLFAAGLCVFVAGFHAFIALIV